MYFRSLEELEAIMRGHATAFDQLGIINREDSFHSCFGYWLYDNTDTSSASGWAHAVELLASNKGDDPVEVFSRLVRRFLVHWNGNDT
jgi:hypothetical protein